MQSSSILCSSNSISPSIFQRFTLLSTEHKVCVSASVCSSSSKLILASSRPRQSSRSTSINSSAAPELVETNTSTSGFIETGYISGVHGLQGEVRVKPSTDFPDLRFSKPGTRWLKQKLSGTETLQEIELLEGRGHPGQSWILKFNEINTVEQARKLVGSTLLVTDEDRPVLEEGEFYTRDLIGMNVIHKVWFLEEETLPVVSSSLDDHGKHKILMKSPWEFVQRPVGSGGFISLLSSQGLLDQLSEMGVEYIEVCSTAGKHLHGSAFLGLVDSCKSNIGVNLYDATMSEEHFDMLLSMSFMKKWVNHVDKLQFHAVLSSHTYVEKAEKEWMDITPSTPNSYEFHSSIYSCLDACSPKKISVMYSAE